MPFDAGSIDATLTADRTPFNEELRLAIADARRFADGSYQARLGLDRSSFNQDLRGAQADLSRVTRRRWQATVGIDDAQLRRELDAAQARLDLFARHRWEATMGVRVDQSQLGQLDRLNQRLSQSEQAAKRDNAQFSLMRTAIEQLGPAIVPLAGGLGAVAVAGGVMGASVMLAFKGISTEMKAGVGYGVQYAGILRGLKDDATTLEASTARALAGPARTITTDLNSQLPLLNGLMATSAHNAGLIGVNLEQGLVRWLQVATPLIQNVEGYAVGLSSRFSQWASGPGGAHFVQTLSTDFKALVSFLAQAGPFVTHLISALQPSGLGALTELSAFMQLVNHLPIGLLQAFTTGYIAFRAAVTVTSGINAATAALERFTVAETAAGAAGEGAAARVGLLGRGAGALRGALAFAGPFAAVTVGAAIALNSASNATEKWRHSIDGLHSNLANLSHMEANMLNPSTWFSGSFMQPIRDQQIANGLAQRNRLYQDSLFQSGVGPAPQGAEGVAQIEAMTHSFQSQFSVLHDVSGELDRYRQRDLAVNAQLVTSQQRVGNLADKWQRLSAQYGAASPQAERARRELTAQEDVTNRLAARYDTLRSRVTQLTQAQALYAHAQQVALDAENRYANVNRRQVAGALTTTMVTAPDLTQGIQGLQSYQTQLAKSIKYEEGWTKATGDNTNKVIVNGKTYTVQQQVIARAMAQTNGNYAKAAGIIAGHERALGFDRAEAERVAAAQMRLSSAVGAAENKYHLTDTQLNAYAASLGVTSRMLAHGVVSQQDFVRAIGQVADFVRNGQASVVAWNQAVVSYTSTTKSAASVGQLLGQSMVALQGDTLGYANTMVTAATANQQLVTDFNQVHRGVINLRTGFIDYHNAGAAPVLQDLQSLQTAAMNAATATYQHERSLVGAKQAAKDAADTFRNDTYGALVDQAHQLGLTDAQAKKLADRYFHWPKNARTLIQQMGGGAVNETLGKILNQLREMNGLKPIVDIQVNADTRDAMARIRDLNKTLAHVNDFTPRQYGNIIRGQQYGASTGATVPGGYGGGDRVPMLLEPGEEVIRKDVARQNRAFLKALNAGRVQMLAGGGTAGHHHEHGGFHGVHTGGGGSGSGGSGSGGSGGGHRSGTGNSVADQVATVLARHGYNARAISGILGNGMEESGLDPYRRQGSAPGSRSPLVVDGNTGYGLWQFTSAGYQEALMRRFGAYPSATQQTEYLVSLIGGMRHSLNNARSAREAADIFMRQFERPGVPASSVREGDAAHFMNQMVHGRINLTSSGGGGTGGTGAPTQQQIRQQRRQARIQRLSNRYYQVGGLQYQGLQAANAERAARESVGSTDIAQVGSGRWAGFGFQGQSYTNIHDAENARVQFERRTVRPIERSAASEWHMLHTHAGRQDLMGRNQQGLQAYLNRIQQTMNAANSANLVPDRMVKQYHADTKQLWSDFRERDKWMTAERNARARRARDRQAADQYQAQVRQSFMGQFDVTQSGNGYAYGIMASLQTATATATKFRNLIRRAERMHLDPRLVRQFLNGGPQGLANLQAIVDAGQGYVDRLDKQYDELYGVSNQIGHNARQQVYAKRLAADTERIKDDAARVRTANEAMRGDLRDIRRVVHSLERRVERTLENMRKG